MPSPVGCVKAVSAVVTMANPVGMSNTSTSAASLRVGDQRSFLITIKASAPPAGEHFKCMWAPADRFTPLLSKKRNGVGGKTPVVVRLMLGNEWPIKVTGEAPASLARLHV